MFLVIYLFFLIYPISVDLAGRIPISASLPAIDCRLHYALLTKRESTRCRILDKFVFFFFAFFMNTRCQCPESWPNKVNTSKGMYKNWTKENFACRTLFLTRKIPSGYDRPILPARVANQNKGIVSYCALADSAIFIIKLPIITSFRPGTCGSTLRFFSVSVLSSDKFLAPWHDLNNGEKDLYSGAP